MIRLQVRKIKESSLKETHYHIRRLVINLLHLNNKVTTQVA